jgi:transcriptional regulator with XRE-family HTH domain
LIDNHALKVQTTRHKSTSKDGFVQISADQCRAARALLDWSQEVLEARSGVAKRTIADFERGGAIPYPRTLAQLSDALAAGGVTFIAENGGGAGVRRNLAVPRLARKKINRFEEEATLIVNYRGADYVVTVPTDILDDIDRTSHETDAQLAASLDAHINIILLRAAAAIDAGRAGDAKRIIMTSADFPEAR